MKTTHKHIRIALFSVLFIFFLATGMSFLIKGDRSGAFEAILMTVLLALPFAAEKLFGFRMSLPFFIFYQCHVLCAMLGHSYKFYYTFPWWDNMLHIFGGALLAVIGWSLPKFLKVHGISRRLVCGIFAVLFAMAASLGWEFIEYGADSFIHTDMQQDTVVSVINTNMLGEEHGVITRIEGIGETAVNGESLGIDGYLELGLIDTMTDTLLGTLGALIATAALVIDNDRHRAMVFEDE
jgi:hypothetical protein